MALDTDHMLSLRKRVPFDWGPREAMLYAVGIGCGGRPENAHDTSYVYERDLQIFPTFPAIFAVLRGAWRETGIPIADVLHGAHAVTLHGHLPIEARGEVDSRIITVLDQRRDALLIQESKLWLDGADEPLATIQTTIIARGWGGFAGPRGKTPRHAMPKTDPDQTVEAHTSPQQAALYRLSGDGNPLHVDMDIARAAGFERPILHGMCTYGIAARLIADTLCGGDGACITHHEGRFSAPVYPGETLLVDLWRDGAEVSYRVRSKARGQTVLDNGFTRLAG